MALSEDTQPRKWRRIHGLQWPWHPQQVVSWVILTFFIVYTFAAIIPNLHSHAQIGMELNILLFLKK